MLVIEPRIKERKIFNIYFKYGIIVLFTVFLLFAKDEEGRVAKAITLNLDLQQFAIGLLIGMILLLIIKSITTLKLDIVSLLLIARILTSYFSLVNYDGSFINFIEAGYFQLIFLSVIYIYTINVTIDDIGHFMTKILIFASVIVIFQVYFVFFNAIMIGVSVTAVKSRITIPLGRSNFVAMMISFLLIYLSIKLKRSKIKYMLIILLLIGLVITLSDGAMLSFLLVILLYVISRITNSYIKILLSTIIILLGILACMIPLDNLYDFGNNYTIFSSFYETISNILSGNLKQASSGRINIYYEYINAISKNPIIGYGFYKPFIKMPGSAHNFILQELYNSGILGLILYLNVLIVSFKKLSRFKNRDTFIKAVYYSCLYIVIHSLIEPGILGYKIGFYFWVLIAAGIVKIKSIRGVKFQ
ncbi:MAG TPA: O-antigen ligase family protein [Patescibacteria group bacterium]|nr:O-antigen ligase family protein [Patescibacteria group bacterium]